ncbi:MAG: DUF429 domain-containing protein [Thermoleophilaceae bacterium]|nr:DUF429 domain-containing protein [Thermoleophilaceae bacterium]
MHYCGVTAAGGFLQLCSLQELRLAEPPVRLATTFYEPGSAEQVSAQLALLDSVVVAIAAPALTSANGQRARACDEELRKRGVAPAPVSEPAGRLFDALSGLGLFVPSRPGATGALTGPVPEAAFRTAAVLETNVDAVFAALQGRRMPARRHPLGILRRIEELADDHVEDEGGDLWHRRIEEIEAAAAALAAHRYAVGHASWIGDPEEGVVVLPGARAPARFSATGVMPPVERASLPGDA